MNSDHVFVIAEAGVNHNGERDMAFALVEAAARSGADAVKFQTFQSKHLASRSAPKASYQKKQTDAAESQLQMLRKLELPQEWHIKLQEHASRLGIEFLSTAFDLESLEFLHSLNLPRFKVPSGELVNGPLLWQFARTGRPLILSTGMATLGEIEQALAIVAHALQVGVEPGSLSETWRAWSEPATRSLLQDRVTLLHCTSQYPAQLEEVNLRAMDTLQAAFGLPVGYSDHTEGILIPLAAVARGARVIEKHLTLDRNLPGPDHRASLEPDEMEEMVRQIRKLQTALGSAIKSPQSSEWDTRVAARQQVVTTREVPAGHIFSREDLRTARCGAGRPALQLWDSIGQTASRGYAAGEALDD